MVVAFTPYVLFGPGKSPQANDNTAREQDRKLLLTFEYFTFEMKSRVLNPSSASSISFSSSDPLYVYHSHHKEATWPAHKDKHTTPDLTEAENLFLHDAIAPKMKKKERENRPTLVQLTGSS